MLVWSFFHPSNSRFPCAAIETAVREDKLWMDGFSLDHPTKYSNKDIKTRGIDYDKGLAVS